MAFVVVDAHARTLRGDAVEAEALTAGASRVAALQTVTFDFEFSAR